MQDNLRQVNLTCEGCLWQEIHRIRVSERDNDIPVTAPTGAA
jgi:hypothetical protein